MLLSVNTGLPKNVDWQGKTVYTGVWKHPVDGPTMVRRLNIDGDGQGDLAGHGGEQRAVLVYQVQSYRHWQQHFGRDDLGYGAVRGEPGRRRPCRRRGASGPVWHRRGRVRGHPAPAPVTAWACAWAPGSPGRAGRRTSHPGRLEPGRW